MNPGPALAEIYDYPMIALSAIISILAAYTALDLTERVRAARGWLRPVWLVSAVMVLGLGVWAMHYVAMPNFAAGLRIRYDWPTTLLSLATVSLASGLALAAVARAGANLRLAAAGSFCLGAGIAATHYFGVTAMRFAGYAVFSPPAMLLSLAASSALAFLALLLAFAPELAGTPWAGRRLAAAIILGFAAPAGHFVWMAGTRFYAAPQLVPDLAYAVAISRFGLSTVSVVSLAVLAHVCTISRIERHVALNERQFLQSQLQLKTVFDNLEEGIAVLDLQGEILVANETTAYIAGFPSAESMRGNLVDLTDAFTLAGDLVPLDERPIRLAMNGQFVHGFEAWLRAKGAPTMSFVEISTAPVPGPDGETAQIIVTYRDITERKRAQEAKARLAAIVESSEDAIVSVDTQSKVTSWNRGAERLFGYSALEMIGVSITRLLPPEREREEDKILERIRLGETMDHFETVRLCKDGRLIDVSLTISPLRDAAGVIVGASKIARNVTETKRQQDVLREQAQLLNASQVLVRDMESRIVFWPEGAQKMYGYTEKEALGATSHELFQTRFPEPVEAIEAELFATGRWEGELEHRRRDGSLIVVSSAWILHRDSSGRPIRILESVIDITERKHADEKLLAQSRELARQAEELAQSRQLLEEKSIMLQSVLDSISEGLVTADEHGQFILWNPAAEKIIGLGISEKPNSEWPGHYGLFLADTVTPLPPGQDPLSIAVRGEFNSAVIFVRNQRLPGGAFLECYATPLRDKSGALRGAVGAFHDITERRRAEEKMRQSEEKFSKAFRSSPIGMSITAVSDGRYVEVNQALANMLGYQESELIGNSSVDLKIWIDSNRRTEIIEKIRRNGTIRSQEVPFQSKSGETRLVNISMETIWVDGMECLLCTAIDVTETRNLEQQLRQSQKMEALGQLTGGIAHDFNNLLGVIVGNLDLLERQVAGNQVALKRVEAARRGSVRGAELTRRLLAFSRREQLNPAPVAVESAIAELVELAARTLGPEIRVSTQCDRNLPRIFVDAAALESALLNLAVNARDAMPRGGSLILSAHLSDLSTQHALTQAGEVPPGKYVRIAVSDTGHGMSRETLERALEPFFTTKPRDKGTGLGLAMVYGFIKQSGGAIRLYSEPGFGTAVSLYLPLADESAQEPEQAAPARTGETLGGTALLVDDEADLLDIADAFLSELGYNVIRAGDSASALAALEQAGDIDLLVTDIIMPGKMNGIELARRVRELRPGIKVIYTSGFPAEALAERSGKLEDGPLLHKPYQRTEFADMVRKSVNAGAP